MKSVLLAGFAGILTFPLLPSLAQEPAAPASATRTVLKPIQFEEYDLPNGLHVILHENHAAPVVTTYVLYHVGSKNERPDRTGFAHFFEHLMFEGSDNIPRGRIDKFISGAGGNLNASTSFDQTDYHFNLPSNELKLALWIESERMLHAKIDQAGVETQRQVVKEERRRGVDNQPYGSLDEELFDLVFHETPYAWVPIGSFQYIDQATIEEFRDFYKKYYLPNNATLSIAGDFKPAELKPLIEQYFGSIPRGTDVERPKMPWPLNGPGKEKTVDKDNTPLPATLHAWRAPSETDPDTYALDLLSNVLATGRSSRLYKRLVEKEQAAIGAEAYPYFLEGSGMVGVFATGQDGVEMPLLDSLITEEIDSVKKDGVTPEEFQKALNQKETEFANAFGTMHARAQNLARYHTFFGDTNLINTELQRYQTVKREDLQRVAQKYFTPEGRYILRYPVPAKKSAGATPEAVGTPAAPIPVAP